MTAAPGWTGPGEPGRGAVGSGSAGPGWYDSGSPGQLRWWDGTRWTDHVSGVATAPPMGWYPAGAGEPRWWDGARWTGLRLRHGRPGTDWATSEQPALAWATGAVFAVLAAAQFALGALGATVSPSGAVTLLLAVLWFAIAAQASRLRRIPPPATGPVVIDPVRPLPGEVERDAGAPAGWYPVAPRTTRWWTGARWSHYLGTAYGVRPAFTGARAYRVLLAMGWSMVGLGMLAVPSGVALLIAGGSQPDPGLLTVIGVVVVIGAVVLILAGVAVLAVTASQRRILLVPADAPAPAPVR